MADKNVRYLNPISIDTQKEKYCRFKKKGIKYIDYKDASFLLMLCNEQGKILPRRLTGTSLKYQRKVAQAIKKSASLGSHAVCG
jgi:small subunit ribosomal protein S18